MARGGYRNGAGRKKGAFNLLYKELREKINAENLIGFLQNLAEGRIKKASISERKDAAIALLKKVLPDYKQLEIPNKESEPIRINIIKSYDGKIEKDTPSGTRL